MINYKQIIIDSLQKVISENGYLGILQNRDIHEQALAHRLAYHLECSHNFTGYHVDCEYNRHGEDIKRGFDGKFRPDIIIHIRGIDDGNLIMIETKKFNDNIEEIENIRQKLVRRRQELGYDYGFVVIFPECEITADSIIEA